MVITAESKLKFSGDKQNVGCMIFSIGEEFRKLADCAVNSFKKFHPDVTLHYIDETNIDSFECGKDCDEHIRNHFGIFRFAIAAEIMEKYNYDKFIVLGSDTITCNRMDEFMDARDFDMCLTSCYAYPPQFPFKVPPGKGKDGSDYEIINVPLYCEVHDPSGNMIHGHFYVGDLRYLMEYLKELEKVTGHTFVFTDMMHVNTDVICFDNLDALKDIFKYSVRYWNDYHEQPQFKKLGYDFYADQGALNIVAAISTAQRTGYPLGFFSMYDDPKKVLPNYKIQYVDMPYGRSRSTYNVRGKKSIQESDLPLGLLNSNRERFGMSFQWSGNEKHPKAHLRCRDQEGKSVGEYYVKDKKLFTIDGKHVKVWHYCAHLGLNTKTQNLGRVNRTDLIDFKEPTEAEFSVSEGVFCDIVNSYVDGVFNEDTKKFFKEECACGDFFDKKFTL